LLWVTIIAGAGCVNDTEILTQPNLEGYTSMTLCDFVTPQNFRKISGLFAIVTGWEHSGTTIVSELIMNAPTLYGGVECGMLCAKEPADFLKNHCRPFNGWMLLPHVWNLTIAQRGYVTQAPCFAEMYHRLRQSSTIYQFPTNKKAWILDKTPRYIRDLERIMDYTPSVPVIVTQKSFADHNRSLRKRGHRYSLKVHQQRGLSLKHVQKKYPHRIHVVNVTEFYRDPNLVMDEAFQFLGLSWNPAYLKMDALNAKHPPGFPSRLPFDDQAVRNTHKTPRWKGDSWKGDH